MTKSNGATVWSRGPAGERQLVCRNLRRDDVNRLRGLTEEGRAIGTDSAGNPVYGQRLIVPHMRIANVWIVAAGVDPSVITAEVRRKVGKRPPVAEDNRTIRLVNNTGCGGYFEHIDSVCFNYGTTRRCLDEHESRKAA